MFTNRRKILLVDDSKEDRFLIRQALADAGLEWEVEEAAEGEQAEVSLEREVRSGEPPHLVILDLHLPKRSGMEVMETWFAEGFTKLTRVIVLSSILPESEVSKLLGLGAWRVFEKPLDLPEFAALGQRVKAATSAD